MARETSVLCACAYCIYNIRKWFRYGSYLYSLVRCTCDVVLNTCGKLTVLSDHDFTEDYERMLVEDSKPNPSGKSITSSK